MFYVIVCTLSFCLMEQSYLTESRKVSALDDICARGAYAFCPNGSPPQGTSADSNSRRDLPQPNRSSNSGTPLSGTPPPLPTVGEYCAQYQEHYQYYCQNSNAKDSRASNFCPTYVAHCDVSSLQAPSQSSPESTTPTPELPPAKIQQICSDYQAIANLYCFRPEIPKGWSVKRSCDLYLKYCVVTNSTQLQQQNKSLQQVLKENIKPCQKYENDYIGFCVQNPKPYNDQVAEFCRNYKSTCVPVQLPTADTLAAQRTDTSQIQQQTHELPQGGSVGNNPSGLAGGNPLAGAGSPISPAGSPPQLGNPNVVSNPIGSLGGNPNTISNPLSTLGGNGAGMGGNPATSMISGMQAAPLAGGPPVGSAGNVPSGMAANPLAVGSQASVGNIAGFSQGTAVNPFGQVATGKNVLAGPVGVQTGQAVDFSGIPGLSQLGSLPGLGRRRRKRDLVWLLWTYSK